MLNRSAVIVRPKEPFLTWTKEDDETGVAETVYETLREEPTVYLVPDFEDEEEQGRLLEEFWPALFDAMLEGWLRDPALWPKKRTLEMFRDWFDVQMLSTVTDIYMDEAIEYVT